VIGPSDREASIGACPRRKTLMFKSKLRNKVRYDSS